MSYQKIYDDIHMLIILIDEVLYKVKDKKLYNELSKEKRNYKKLNKLLKGKIDKESTKIFTRLSIEFINEIKYINSNDNVLKKLIILNTYKVVNNNDLSKENKIFLKINKYLKKAIKSLKKIDINIE